MEDLGGLVVARSDFLIRALEELDINSADNIDEGSLSLTTRRTSPKGWRFARTIETAVLASQTQFGRKDHNRNHAQSYTSILSIMRDMPDEKELFRSSRPNSN